jgi:Domain of unknown function (DUF4288)
MRWYTARVLFRCDVAGKPHSFEESYLMVRASDEEGAAQAASEAAAARGGSYRNPRGERVSVRVLSVLEAQEVLEDELTEGVEVYSRSVTRRTAEAMLKSARRAR